jgi:hypothetical protein
MLDGSLPRPPYYVRRGQMVDIVSENLAPPWLLTYSAGSSVDAPSGLADLVFEAAPKLHYTRTGDHR